jgi:hypothetical protein
MTKLADLKKMVDSFQLKVTKVAEADKTGGPTWKLVVKEAQAIPAALKTQIIYIQKSHASVYPPDKLKIPGYFKTMKDQWSVVKIVNAKKYSLEHKKGGAKSRASGIKGLLTSSATQKLEVSRVATCDLLIQQYTKLNLIMKSVSKAGDFDDMEGV